MILVNITSSELVHNSTIVGLPKKIVRIKNYYEKNFFF